VSLASFVTFLFLDNSVLHVVVQLSQMVVSILVVVAVLRKRPSNWMIPYLVYALFYLVYTQLVGWPRIFANRVWVEPAPSGKYDVEKVVSEVASSMFSSVPFQSIQPI